MNGKKFMLVLAAALLGGVIGGAAMSRFVAGTPARASDKIEGQKILAAEKFVLVNDRGEQRAVLGLIPDNELSLPGESGFMSDKRAALALYDDDDNRRAVFSIFGGNRSGIGFFDDRNNLVYRLSMGDFKDREPSIVIEGKDGKVQAALSFNRDNKSGLTVTDKDGNKLFTTVKE